MDHDHSYAVHGTVTGPGGEPSRQARVVIWWQQIRERAELAAGETGEDGKYQLSYQIPPNASQPLIVVEALSEFLDEPLFSAPTRAQPDLAIDLHCEPPDESEWETLARSLNPLLTGVTLAELVENGTHHDISFLARQLVTDTETIMRAAICARLEEAFDIPAPAFYAFLRQRVPAGLPSPLLDASHSFTLIAPLVQSIGSMIVRMSAQAQTRALSAAVARHLISASYSSQIPQLVSRLQALRSADLLSRPYLGGKTPLADLLDVPGLAREKHPAVARALAAGTPPGSDFCRASGDGQHGVTAEESAAIQRTLSVGALIDNHLPLVQQLVQEFSAGTYHSLSDLAWLSRADWVRLVGQAGPPPHVSAAGTVPPAEVFAGTIHARVSRAYPTLALASRIPAGTFVPAALRQPLTQFFRNSPGLELVTDDLHAHLADAEEGAFAGIRPEDRAAVVAQARSFQRVLRVAPDPDVTRTLLAAGFTSASQMAALGRQQFVAKATTAGLTEHEAWQAFEAAAQRQATVMSLYMQHNADAIGVLPKAIGQFSAREQAVQEAVAREPSLATLFGSQDYCATDDCSSVLSPAAYLCDLLLWLRGHHQDAQTADVQTADAHTALDVLDSRRPDIRHLLLNCPNTDTELPYIDLVNELLADAISPPINFDHTSYVQTGLANGTTYYYIVTAVDAAGESTPSLQACATAGPPAAPSLAVTPYSAQITLSWDPVPSATSYNVYWSATPGVTPATGTRITDAMSPYTQSQLTDGTTYHYVITAVNAAGEGPPSSETSATSGAPLAPGGLFARPGDTQVTVSWDPVPSATSYNVYWSATPGVTPATGTRITGAASQPVDSTYGSYVQTGLVNGTTYYYVVTAVNAAGESAPSAQLSATPFPTVIPAAPTGLFAVESLLTWIELSWNRVPGAASYNVYRSTTAGVTTANSSKIAAQPDPVDHYQDRGTQEGATYYYIVTAVNAAGESAPSPEASATPGAHAPLAVPGGLSATPGDTEVTVSWDAVPGTDQYTIYWSTTTGVTTATGTPIFNARSPYTQSQLANGTTYYYIVTADPMMPGARRSAPSPEVSATPAIPAPSGLSARPGDSQVTLSWDPVSEATSYNIYWSTAAGVTPANGSKISEPTSTDPRQSCTQRGLINGIAYYYIVTAIRADGEGAPSAEISATPGAPPAPGGLSASPGDSQVTLSWDPVPEATSYNIYWSATPGVTIASGPGITGAWNPTWKQTSADKTAADLSAAPEYFNQGAFAILSGASYPFTLPYSAGLDELRTYLRQLKLPLWQLRQALLPLSGAPPGQQAAVAAERFGLTQHAADLVTNANFVPAAVAWNRSDTPAGLTPVDDFLAAASLSYESLLELIDVAWVQDGLNVTIQGLDDSCDISSQSLTPLAGQAGLDFLDRAHRFLRLRLATGYQMWELDRLLAAPAVANGTLDQQALTALLAFRQLQDATGLAVDQQLVFYQDIDTATHRNVDGSTTASLYTRTFLNAAATSSRPDPDLAALLTGSPLAYPALSKHLPGIQAAVAVTAADATALFSLTDNTLTLANLSLIYRVAALARAAALSAPDLLTVASLLDPAAAGPADAVAALFASPAVTLAFLNQAAAIQQQASLDLDALTYLLTPPDAKGGWPTTTQMTQQDIAAALAAVQQTVAAVQSADADLEGTVIAAVAANAHTASSAGIANDVSELILRQLQVPGTGQTLLAVLADSAFTTGPAGPPTLAAFPHQFLALQLFDKAAVLVRGLRLVATDLRWLLDNAAGYGGLDLAQLPVAPSQAAVGLRPLLTTLLAVKLARLWTAAPPSAPVQTLYDLIADVLNGTVTGAAQAHTALAFLTGWAPTDITAFAAALGLAFPADYTQPTAYDALRTLAAMAATTGATGTQLVSWGAVPASEAAAASMAAGALGVVKAQQPSDDTWLALSAALTNPLRENRSAVLQAYLIAQRDSSGDLAYADADDLFDCFLIDVQMSSCQVTSRVVQAYIAVQTFVERCLMNLEEQVTVGQDGTWNQWQYISRYRVWEANREVFLYPENWLVESQRPSRTEIYQQLEQEVHQGQSTADYLETVVLNYLDRLDGLAHLQVTGTCQDPAGGTIYAVARTAEDPPTYYLCSYDGTAWTGWTQIPLDIKAYHAVPVVYRGRVCLFWLDVAVSNEPQQPLPAVEQSPSPPAQIADRYVSLGVNFSMFRNGSWMPAQAVKGKLFDKPFFDPVSASNGSSSVSNARAVEALYTLKVQAPTPAPGYGASLFIDVFRLGEFQADPSSTWITSVNQTVAPHLGRAVFNGRFGDLELRDTLVPTKNGSPAQQNPAAGQEAAVSLLDHAQKAYGPDAQLLLPLFQADPALGQIVSISPELLPQAGALTAPPADPGQSTFQLTFGLVEGSSTLGAAPIPSRIVGPDTDVNFDLGSYFFFADNRRCYWVQTQSMSPDDWPSVFQGDGSLAPSRGNGSSVTFYIFHPFYHPFTGLFWNQLAGGGFDSLYDPDLQQAPDAVDPGYSDAFSFRGSYQAEGYVGVRLASVSTTLASEITPAQTTITVTRNVWVPLLPFYVQIGSEVLQVTGASGTERTTWTVVRGTVPAPASAGAVVTAMSLISVTSGAQPQVVNGQDRQFLDFSPDVPFAVYNWELFYHIPLYIAQLLSQNQQFEDAQTWFHYIFNPTRQGGDPAPQRFWIPKPLHDLTSADIQQQQIANLLTAVHQGDKAQVQLINSWRNDPFNPFLLAGQRPVAYIKAAVMSYLDNLIAWGDNLFAADSREALGEATLLYVIASEILGPQPAAVTPPQHADQSFDQLEPGLDAFANAMVEIENVIGATGASAAAGGSASTAAAGSASTGTGLSLATFYFKIPSNAKLLGYWTTVADRLYKLRHCQDITGAPLSLALFDAPIDPGLLIAAQAAGLDISSVLSPAAASLPSYRFTSLYPQALDFANAVRAYGASLQAALEKSDAGALTLLQQTTQQQLLSDQRQILDWQVQQANCNIDNMNQAVALAQQKYNFNSQQVLANVGEVAGMATSAVATVFKNIAAATKKAATVVYLLPEGSAGVSGFGGSPQAAFTEGGKSAGDSAKAAGLSLGDVADIYSQAAKLMTDLGGWRHRKDAWDEAAAEAQIQIKQANAQLQTANLALQIAQAQQARHQEQIDILQKQGEFLNSKFTSESLYDWMAAQLSATYFQSYQLAYQLCQQLECCYRFELGVHDTNFIQFGYWDSLYKGLLAGETLSQDLRRMQASYLQRNARRYELSRYISLGQLNPAALQQLLATGQCDFTLPESLFDNDYPGHYNRRLTRVSLTVVYLNPGRFDNIKATLTLVHNKVRIKNDTSAGYAESPVGSDKRFLYDYAAVPQKIATGNAQDDPGLFVTAIASNIADQRYVPFENAGAASSWHLDMPQATNEVDLSTVGDVVLHLYYTALDGGSAFQEAVQQYNQQNAPTSGTRGFSAQNDFAAPAPTTADPYPLTPWQAFLASATPPANQVLKLSISPSKFPPWTRGKTISVTSITVLAVSWTPGNFVLTPQAPLPTAAAVMTPVEGVTEPNVCTAEITIPSGVAPGTWSFQVRRESAQDFRSLTKNDIGDVLLLVEYQVSEEGNQ